MQKRFLLAAAIGLGLAAGTPALAQTGAAPANSAEPAAIDPARLAAARVAVDAIFPPGTYARMMRGMTGKMMDKMLGSAGEMPIAQFGAAFGARPAELQKLGKTTINDIMAIYDPAYQQRMQIAANTLMPAMIKLMTEFEPDVREGLTRAYARRFSGEELADMNRFFATPSGHAYATEAMAINGDPEVVDRMTAAMPKFMQSILGQMGDLGKQIEAETAKLPKPRTYKDLTPAERTKLASLLGISETDLQQQAAGNSAGH